MWGDLTAWMDAQVYALAGLSTPAVALAAYVFLALETSLLIGLVVPGDVVVLIAAGLMPSWGASLLLVAAVLAGTLTGELVGYGLGRAAGPALRRSWAGRRMGPQRWQRAEAFLAGRGARALVPLRFVAVVQAVTPVVAGTVRMPFRRFLHWSALGSLLWAVTFVGIGTLAGASLAGFDWTLRIGLVAVLAVVVGSVLGGRTLRRHRVRPEGLDPTTSADGTPELADSHPCPGAPGPRRSPRDPEGTFAV